VGGGGTDFMYIVSVKGLDSPARKCDPTTCCPRVSTYGETSSTRHAKAWIYPVINVD